MVASNSILNEYYSQSKGSNIMFDSDDFWIGAWLGSMFGRDGGGSSGGGGYTCLCCVCCLGCIACFTGNLGTWLCGVKDCACGSCTMCCSCCTDPHTFEEGMEQWGNGISNMCCF